MSMTRGSFSLAEMAEVKGPLGLGIERDLYFSGKGGPEPWHWERDREHGGFGMKCAVCGGEIEKKRGLDGKVYWEGSNNPDPVKIGENDRCCDVCDMTVVIPARIAMVMEDRKGDS